jgi:hypothetical protein
VRYLLRKIGFYLVARWAAVTVNFLIPRLMPGDPVDLMLAKLGQHGPVTPEIRQAIEALLGSDTDKSWPAQYADYLHSLVTGDLGVSVTYFPASVSSIIAQTLPWTIGLIGLSTDERGTADRGLDGSPVGGRRTIGARSRWCGRRRDSPAAARVHEDARLGRAGPGAPASPVGPLTAAQVGLHRQHPTVGAGHRAVVEPRRDRWRVPDHRGAGVRPGEATAEQLALIR